MKFRDQTKKLRKVRDQGEKEGESKMQKGDIEVKSFLIFNVY